MRFISNGIPFCTYVPKILIFLIQDGFFSKSITVHCSFKNVKVTAKLWFQNFVVKSENRHFYSVDGAISSFFIAQPVNLVQNDLLAEPDKMAEPDKRYNVTGRLFPRAAHSV